MAYRTTSKTTAYGGKIEVDFGNLNARQQEFFDSKVLYTGYGGAKGGGKTHAVRIKAVFGAMKYSGIKILILRRTYPELQSNHIEPICRFVPQQVGQYNGSLHTMYFVNGSIIKFGHYQSDAAELEYQGQEFDWIFMDEATQFTWRQFQYIRGCLRGATSFPKLFGLTFNPGGVGHRWVKRLFIDKQYITGKDNPEENEKPKDYKFVFASIDDNTEMQRLDPVGYENYKSQLSQMPENMRAAFRYGKWDELGGNYFPEFGERHIVRKVNGKYEIPGFESFVRYRSLDYGFDMTACLWEAVDHIGRTYVYREFNQGKDNNKPELIASDAANEIKSHTLPSERITTTIVPPDLWKRGAVDGKCAAEDLMLNGVSVWKANNDRAQGGMQIKEMLKDAPDGKPWLMIFEDCKDLITNLTDIQSDEKDLNKYSTEPHDISHNVDSLRYFCISRTLPTDMPSEPDYKDDEDEEEYDEYMTGGCATDSYLSYGQRR